MELFVQTCFQKFFSSCGQMQSHFHRDSRRIWQGEISGWGDLTAIGNISETMDWVGVVLVAVMVPHAAKQGSFA